MSYILSLDEVDDINLKITEALAMVEVLAAAGMGRVIDEKHLYTFASLLQEKLEAVKEGFDKAIKDKEAA
jgi:hypothetical protein